MRFSKYYLSIAPLAAWLSVGTACQSARPATFLPQAQATAPALTAKAAPSPAAPAVEVETSTIKPEVRVAPKTDPVADLLAQIEKEYQNILANGGLAWPAQVPEGFGGYQSNPQPLGNGALLPVLNARQ